MSNEQNLTPEQRKAIKVLQEILPFYPQYLCDDITKRDICYTDFKAFTTQKISYSDLHHGVNWTWNQSNAKKKVLLYNDHYVMVQKFNTRKRTKNIPSNGIVFKLWIFTIYRSFDNSFVGIFIWCEKGMPPINYSSDEIIGYCFPDLDVDDLVNISSNDQLLKTSVDNITLDDLEFLRPFVDAQTAASFGW